MKNPMALISMMMMLALAALAAPGATNDNQTISPMPYPLKTCLVCGMRLGDMGKPFAFVYKNQEIKVCDKSEQEAFDKNPGKYMKKFAAAVAKLKK
jgi:nitrous oxide reductase accessory protein NosL